jgi:ATP-dependent DNA helicase RecQ
LGVHGFKCFVVRRTFFVHLYTDFMTSEADLLTPLRRYWGYDSFRPLQERIVRSLLAGHDTCVVMPTGGGKSLCYQLPAVVSERTTVVISPLIALMQDQAAQLAQMGIPAAVLNSSVSNEEQNRVIRQARDGAFRLLYLSPERLQRADTLAWLQQVPISFFAIDEAHCISEWGHEFRPEYRQLSSLRGKFPDRPIAAFTASATRHVRHDILAQLKLRNPDKYIASFHRPNLRYLVRECDSAEHTALLVTALRHYDEGNVIVYSPTINKVEETVDFLGDQGIAAVGYHAKMDSVDRRRNQERWMSDEVRVLVGTIAFGLGINKATVRAVIHLALPKSVEQFYQEAGRAGRDGNPADCILLWRKQDAGLLGYFANQVLDAAERERAWQRYHTIRAFAESGKCRHGQICALFGETPKWTSCGGCDVCGAAPDWLTETVAPAVRRTPVSVASTGVPAAAKLPVAANQDLREYLREWRRTTAKEHGMPAYVVLHDSSLDEICRLQPNSIVDLLRVTGIGERKADLYGQAILTALRQYRDGARASAPQEKKTAPALETLQLLKEGKTFEDIARIRARQIGTVINAVAGLVEKGDLEFRPEWIDRNKLAVIEAACERHDVATLVRLRTLKDVLPPEITYDEIRLVVAKLRRQVSSTKASIPA